MNSLVRVLEVAQLQGLAQHHLVHVLDEEAVEELPLIQGLADDASHEPEHCHHLLPLEQLGIGRGEVGTGIGALLEQCIIGIEDALRDKLEPLPGKTTFVHALLVVERDHEPLAPGCHVLILELLEAV